MAFSFLRLLYAIFPRFPNLTFATSVLQIRSRRRFADSDVRVFRRIEDMKALAFALSFVTQRAELHPCRGSSRRKLAGDAYCGLRTQKVRRRNIRAISIGTMAGRCCVKRGSIAFAKSQLTMIVCSSLQALRVHQAVQAVATGITPPNGTW